MGRYNRQTVVRVRDVFPGDETRLVAIRPGVYRRYLDDAGARSAAFVLAEIGSTPVGFALVYLVAGMKSHTPKLSDVFVNEDHRRQGVASALITECERRARHAGFAELFVSVEPANEGMCALLRARGYEALSGVPYPAITPEGVRYERIDLRRELA